MSDLIRQIQIAQRSAGEAAVIASLKASGLITAPQPEHAGELDPRKAADTARQMLRYVDAFNGQQWCGSLDSVDRQNLAVALDNLQETAAMLLNLSERVPVPAAKHTPTT